MAPKFNEILDVPEGVDGASSLNKDAYQVPSLVGRWQPGMRYLDYSYNCYKSYA